jgi:hypothetical protein
VLLLAPIACCFVAACAHAYPYGGARTSAFLAPVICLLTGAGFGASLAGRVMVRRGAWGLAGIGVGIALVLAGKNLVVPRTRSHVRPVVEYLAKHRKPGDAIYVIGGAASDVYRCYVDPIDPLTTLTVVGDHVSLKDYAVPAIPPGRRAWLVVAGSKKWVDSAEPLLVKARAVGTQRDKVTVRGGAAYCFEGNP